jgi:hypothetical protein
VTRRCIAALAALCACADYTNSPDPTFGLPDMAVTNASLSRDVQPIFTKRCSIGGCHSLATRQGGLALSEGASHGELVNRPARLTVGRVLVRPFAAGDSWLMAMIEDDPSRRHGLARMPLASSPLTANQIRTIANWIDRGAPND